MQTFQLGANYSKVFLNALLSESNLINLYYKNVLIIYTHCLYLELTKDARRKVDSSYKGKNKVEHWADMKDVCDVTPKVAFHPQYLSRLGVCLRS